jgi:hypothetical protein
MKVKFVKHPFSTQYRRMTLFFLQLLLVARFALIIFQMNPHLGYITKLKKEAMTQPSVFSFLEISERQWGSSTR